VIIDLFVEEPERSPRMEDKMVDLQESERRRVRKLVTVYFTLCVVLVAAILPFLLLTNVIEDSFQAMADVGLHEFKTSYLYAVEILTKAPEAWPGIALIVAQPWTPAISAFLVVLFMMSRGSLKEWFGRYRPWQPGVTAGEGLRVWGIALAVVIGLSLAKAVISSVVVGDRFLWSPPSLTDPMFVVLLFAAMFLDGGGLAEEGGWRGFLQPILQASYSPVKAAVIVGLLWSLWHVPVKADALASLTTFVTLYLPFTIFCVALSVVMAYFSNRVGGSALMGVMLHGVSNDSIGLAGTLRDDPLLLSDTMGISMLHDLFLQIPVVIVAVFLIVRTGGRLAVNETAIMRPNPKDADDVTKAGGGVAR
jgi:membrane protease YdiL (CAAX protease family)